jgi:hypothetical protein
MKMYDKGAGRNLPNGSMNQKITVAKRYRCPGKGQDREKAKRPISGIGERVSRKGKLKP